MISSKKRTREEKVAENFFPLDSTNVKRSIEKAVKKQDIKDFEEVEEVKQIKGKRTKSAKKYTPRKTQTKKDPMTVLDEAMKNVSPALEVRARRVGGATYQVPREVRPERRLALSMRWLIGAAESKKGKPMHEKLAEELVLAAKNEGSAIKKKIDTHRMADANKAFAHFAW